MKYHQVAYYCQSKEAEDNIKKTFGLINAKWMIDTVTGLSEVRGMKPQPNVAEIQMNHDLGFELELLRYIDGKYWQQGDIIAVPYDVPVFSHVGIYLDDGKDFPVMAKNWRLVQETFTQRHNNPDVKCRYHYRIYDTMNRSYIKFIKKRYEA
jgi:hypothetical protein